MARIKSPFRVIGRVREKLRRKNIETPIHPGIFDLHVDGSTPEAILNRGKLFEEMHQVGEVDRLPDGQTNMQDISFPGMVKGGYVGALANSFPYKNGGSPSHEEFWTEYKNHASIYERAVNDNPGVALIVKNRHDLLNASVSKKIALIKSIEGLYISPNEKGLKTLEKLVNDGVRSFGIMWNIDNGIGTSQKTESDGVDKGLTDFGHEVINYLNDADGVLIDISHSSAKTMEEILRIVGDQNGKIIASHSGIRGRNMSRRNLPPEIAKAVGKKGIIGVPIHRNFVIAEEDRTNPDVVSTTDDVLKIFLELREFIGSSENLCIGSDFGGLGKRTATLGLEDCSTFGQCLYEKMIKSKEFTDEEIEGIFNKNALRFFAQALPAN